MPDEIDEVTAGLLDRFGFDATTFETLRAHLRAEGVDALVAANRLPGRVDPPSASDVGSLPPAGSPELRELAERGTAAIRAGQVAAVVLAGGMATRFGGVVKAAVPVIGGRTFLDLKLAAVQRIAEKASGTIPVWLMASFATQDEIERLGAAGSTARAPVTTFPQAVSLRLTPEGDLFRDAAGALSPYAPGHGDLFWAARRAGLLHDFVIGGGRVLYMSNVDNLGAAPDPAIIGWHLAHGAAATVECVRKDPGDVGGGPARVEGTPQIVEDFRFPEGFDRDSVPVFNTNTMIFDTYAVDREFPLTWFTVQKTVDDRPAIQFERLVGEVTKFVFSGFLEVERRGPGGRFQPVKDPDELQRRLPEIEEILRARGILEPAT